jgi:hypothetical protein
LYKYEILLSFLLYRSAAFFGGGRGSNPGPYIFYALSIPTELSSRGHIGLLLNYTVHGPSIIIMIIIIIIVIGDPMLTNDM